MDRRITELQTVHSRDLDNLLRQVGLLEVLEEGQGKCKFCKELVTRDNIYSVLRDSGAFHFVCDKPECVTSLLEYLEEKKRRRIDD